MTSIYVRGFPRRTGQRDLQSLFGTFGKVNDVRMVRDFAFVSFKDKESGAEAARKMNGQNYQGYQLIVEIAKEKPGPKPSDICRSCGKKGHWQNSCPYERRRKRSESEYSSSSSSSSSSSEKKHKKKKKSKKIHKKRKYSSSSSDSRSSSSESKTKKQYKRSPKE